MPRDYDGPKLMIFVVPFLESCGLMISIPLKTDPEFPVAREGDAAVDWDGLSVLVFACTFRAPDATPGEAHHHHPDYGDTELHAEPNGIQ